MNQTFDFGYGLVPARKHENGGGWVALTATVDPTAHVSGSAQVHGSAHVSGSARVFGNAYVSGDAHVFGNAHVSGSAHVFGNAHVYGSARVFGSARVYGDAQVHGSARVSRTPIVIAGAEYIVTICDAPYITVGCQIATLAGWEAGHAPESCPILEQMRPHLIVLARIHHV